MQFQGTFHQIGRRKYELMFCSNHCWARQDNSSGSATEIFEPQKRTQQDDIGTTMWKTWWKCDISFSFMINLMKVTGSSLVHTRLFLLHFIFINTFMPCFFSFCFSNNQKSLAYLWNNVHKNHMDGNPLKESSHSTSTIVCACICRVWHQMPEVRPIYTFVFYQKWILEGQSWFDIHDFLTQHQCNASRISKGSIVQEWENSASQSVVCLGLVFVIMCETMPAVDYSKITEMVKAEKGPWTSCWAELEVMNRTQPVITWNCCLSSNRAE